MKINIDEVRIDHVHLASADEVASIKHSLAHLITQGYEIMATQAELAIRLNALGVELGKVGSETTTLIQTVADLKLAVEAAGNVTPEVEAAMAAVEAQAKVVDDLVPDAPIV